MAINTKKNDLPVERFVRYGQSKISDTELLAILLGTGTPKSNVLLIAEQILHLAHNNLHQLIKMDFNQLINIEGVGQKKAVRIFSALELGKRAILSVPIKQSKLHCAQQIGEHYQAKLSELSHEEAWLILVDQGLQIISEKQISQGGIQNLTLDPRLLFKQCLLNNASSFILIHNHPSGQLTPSTQDQELTLKLKKMARIMMVNFLDHIIVSHQGFYSFAANDGLK